MTTNGDLWSSFPLDPRDRAHAGLRASDVDRERITAVLTTAFADGRLEREELDERMAAAAAARTLGELPPIVADLVPMKTVVAAAPRTLAALSPAEIEARAQAQWRERCRSAVFTALGSGLVFWAIWFAVGADGFPWPLLVNAFALLNVVRVLSSREEIVASEVRRLEKKQARQLRWPRGLP